MKSPAEVLCDPGFNAEGSQSAERSVEWLPLGIGLHDLGGYARVAGDFLERILRSTWRYPLGTHQ
jgi:hypothetical protein